MSATYGARAIKRHRRSKVEIETIKTEIQEMLNTTTVAERSERELLRAWAEQLEARP